MAGTTAKKAFMQGLCGIRVAAPQATQQAMSHGHDWGPGPPTSRTLAEPLVRFPGICDSGAPFACKRPGLGRGASYLRGHSGGVHSRLGRESFAAFGGQEEACGARNRRPVALDFRTDRTDAAVKRVLTTRPVPVLDRWIPDGHTTQLRGNKEP